MDKQDLAWNYQQSLILHKTKPNLTKSCSNYFKFLQISCRNKFYAETTQNFVFNDLLFCLVCLFFLGGGVFVFVFSFCFFVVFLSSMEMSFTVKEKNFWVSEYVRTQSNKTVQRTFQREYDKNAPISGQICAWPPKKIKDEGQKELHYRLDMSRVIGSAYIENLWNPSWNPHTFKFLFQIFINMKPVSFHFPWPCNFSDI